MTAPSVSRAERTRTADLRVALVCMPFYGADSPSIQIGLLRAISEQHGFPTDSFHFTLNLAARLTPEIYEPLCAHRGRMTGDWLFSVAAFGESVNNDDQAYFDAFPDEIRSITKAIGKDASYLSMLRHELLPAFIDGCLAVTDWGNYGVVGFTSTFQQNVASLALARRIKERYPNTRIVFGGANFEDEMGPEYVRAFPFIDYAVVGEGDKAFPALLQCLAAGEEPLQIPGVVLQSGGEVRSGGQAPPLRELNDLPVPVYDEYFQRLELIGTLDRSKYPRVIPFESSRGCWWGQKHHCTFCGLNGQGLTYRAKGSDRVMGELTSLAHKHGITAFEAVDNILDMSYVKEFFSEIEQAKTDYTFFYETKANLTPAQLRVLQRGGVRTIQPGIESLSSHVLQLMRKGCTMLQNVRFLKWARYYGIRVSWNLIWGFPGEREEDYQRQLEVAKLLSHLDPPGGWGPIWLERFSPYFTERDAFPIHDVRPESSYSYVYPSHVCYDQIAYFFEYTMDDTLPGSTHAATDAWCREWRERQLASEPDTLFYRRTTVGLLIDDNRGTERRGTHTFFGPHALIYECCSETMRTVSQVQEQLQAASEDYAYPAAEVEWALEEFCRRGLMISEDGRYLSLALPSNPNW